MTQRRSDMSTEPSVPRSGRVIDQRSVKPSSPVQAASWSALVAHTATSAVTERWSRSTAAATSVPTGIPATISLRSWTWKDDDPSTACPARRSQATWRSGSCGSTNGFQPSGTARPGTALTRPAICCTAVCTRHRFSTSAGTSLGFTLASARRCGASRSRTAISRRRRPHQDDAAAVCAAT